MRMSQIQPGTELDALGQMLVLRWSTCGGASGLPASRRRCACACIRLPGRRRETVRYLIRHGDCRIDGFVQAARKRIAPSRSAASSATARVGTMAVTASLRQRMNSSERARSRDSA